MRRTRATFVNNLVEPGWPILSESVPLGKTYVVDFDRIEALTMTNRATGRSVRLDCIMVLEPGPPGWLPLLAFKIDADA